MSFPLIPAPRAPVYARGSLSRILVVNTVMTSHALTLGAASENRTIIVAAVGNTSGPIGVWSAPTIDGVAMTEVVQVGTTASSDGQRGAIWVMKQNNKASATLAGTLSACAHFQVFVMTGVADPVASAQIVTGSPSASVTSPVPSCAVEMSVHSGGSFTSISNMTTSGVTTGFGPNIVGYNPLTSASPTTYTYTGTGAAFVRYVTWPFAY